MPELPEVQGFRNYIELTSLDQPIAQVEVSDAKVVKGNPETFAGTIRGQRFVATERVGKYLFLHLSGGGAMLMHFGMTGSPHYYQVPEDAPRHERVGFHFENGYRLGYNCPRKFGRLLLVDDIQAYCQAKKIGPDAHGLAFEVFRERIETRQTPIKAALLNQSILAGVGNWIADEVLWQVGIHPEEVVRELGPDDLRSIHHQLQYVLDTALRHDAHFPDFPREFMIHSRWTDSGRPDAPRIAPEKITVGGRSTYFDPTRQQKRG